MDYIQARNYLNGLSGKGSVLGLERMRSLLELLGNPQDALKFIHIAGTNGKGSVLAYISTILTGAGYRTGRYISPTLFSYRERIQVDEKEIERESLAVHVTAISEAIETMQAKGEDTPTLFEVETAMAFLYFKEKECDIVVLETGLGGTQDATNVISTTVLEIITSISMDHTAVLGDTLEKIAAEKAGIIKPDTMVVSAVQQPEAQQVIEETCRKKNCGYRTVDSSAISGICYGYERQSFSYRSWVNISISLAGSYQIQNAALALEAVEALRKTGFSLSDRQVYDGLLNTRWKGRFTVIQKNPAVVLDGAHNPAAAEELRRSLNLYFKGKKLYYIFGMFQDKDYKKVIELTAPLAEHIITVETRDNPRAMPAKGLAKAVAAVNPSVEAADSIQQAVSRTMEQADDEDAVIIFGSLSFLGEAEKAVKNYRKPSCSNTPERAYLMERIDKICCHALWRSYTERICELEHDRIFCGHDTSHFLDVARLAYIENLERKLNISKELIYAAALLHDIGRHLEYLEGIPHDKASAMMAGDILKECGFDQQEQNEIITAIAQHRNPESANKDNLSGLLYRADKKSRPCLFCKAEKLCNWSFEKKNMNINV
ncbi:MAG: Mur ligase family protein [Oscillospiraceae bacterium]|nr:Mur ligase family protein [Oscillospiraceae bacterium]